MAASWRDRIIGFFWPRMGLKRYGRYLLRRLSRLKASPHAVGAGVAAGAAVSMFPLIGLHFVLGFVLAYLTRGSLVAAAIGTAWGNPFTFPIFFGAAYQVGDVLTGHARLIDPAVLEALGETMDEELFTTTSTTFWPVFKTMMIGAAPLSVVVWIAFYVLTRTLVERLRAARDRRRAALEG